MDWTNPTAPFTHFNENSAEEFTISHLGFSQDFSYLFACGGNKFSYYLMDFILFTLTYAKSGQ